ncbi:MAG: RluA family pseudouridine synthase [Lachnospiraceae bacterium]|nr:RluA family pseudouridine synthase [Lachnospiraceae bacterium]
MKEYVIEEANEGLRLDKQLFKILNNAGTGFVYKMLRKKNITLNGGKASGSEHLKTGDVIRIYLSDDTFALMSIDKTENIGKVSSCYDLKKMIIYEDRDIIILNKPSGMLSQKVSPDDVSINELCLKYLMDKGETDNSSLKVFKPSICNRLDRNTSGIVIFAKTYSCASTVSKLLKEHMLGKYYKCMVAGKVIDGMTLDGFLIKDEHTNKVTISNSYVNGASRILTSYRPLESYDDRTLLEVKLLTGRSHQIRAHLASISHPVLGDHKYGDKKLNRLLRDKYGISSQMLHAYKLEFPEDMPGVLSYLGSRFFIAPVPEEFAFLNSGAIQ